MERRAARILKWHQTAAKSAANKVTEDQDRAEHEAAMAAHIGQQAIEAALAAGATNQQAIAAGVEAKATALEA
jgi:hypothetical protein